MSAISSRLAILPLLAVAATATATKSSVNSHANSWEVSTRICAPRIPAPLQHHARYVCPVVLDEATARIRGPSSWSPWTHAPVCTAATNKDDDNGAQQFCVYTNDRHGIGGLSIVTTPETAATSIDVWDEEISALEVPSDKGPAYKIVDLPGRGKGVVAARRIAQYDAFMVDYAALVVDLQVAETVARDAGYGLLSVAANQTLSPDRVLRLAQTSTAARHPVENVLRSNAFHTALGAEGAGHMALFPDLARINHACMPNAYPRFMPHSLAVSVAASRDIAPGEEITISYIPLGQTRAARQQALLRWEFVCACPLCAASSDEVETSDARRTKIDRLREEVAEAVHGGNRGEKKMAIEKIRDIFPLLGQEDLYTAYSEQYANVGRLYWALGDQPQARFYAQRSLDTLAEQGFIAPADRTKVHLLLRSFDG